MYLCGASNLLLLLLWKEAKDVENGEMEELRLDCCQWRRYASFGDYDPGVFVREVLCLRTILYMP